ncbi:hypothetical protein JCM8097_004582 [Rhodosporidiobolus ruineniae]
MVRRILEDSYKPLRVKGYQKPTPKPAPLPSELFASSSDPVEPSATPAAPQEPEQQRFPWEFSFKAPDNYNPAPGYRARSPLPVGRTVAEKRAVQRAGGVKKARLASAYEKTLDYRSGVHGKVRDEEEQARRDANQLGSMSGFDAIVENRILQAKREGLFRTLKGRGKPIPRDVESESNPYISRSDFLINRIMKDQDCAPPWVEMQKDLDTSTSAFRSELRANYSRRVLRIRSSEGLTPAVVREVRDGWKDEEWERREKAYHDAALLDLNNLTRKYNVIAPYHVRRSLLTLRSELDAAIAACAESLAVELQRRLDVGMSSGQTGKVVWEDPSEGVRSITAEEMGGERKAVKETMWSAFRRLVVETLAQPPDPVPAMAAKKQ